MWMCWAGPPLNIIDQFRQIVWAKFHPSFTLLVQDLLCMGLVLPISSPPWFYYQQTLQLPNFKHVVLDSAQHSDNQTIKRFHFHLEVVLIKRPSSFRIPWERNSEQKPPKTQPRHQKRKTHLQTLIVSLDSWSSTLVVHTNTLWTCTSLWQPCSRHCATHVPPRVLVLMRVTPKHWPNVHVDVLTTNATKLSRQIKESRHVFN